MRASYNLDRDLRFVSANDIALDCWKVTLSDVVGRRLAEAFPAVVGSAPYEAHLKALRSFKPFHGVVISPVLAEAIDLEIFPSAQGLYVSFMRLVRS